MRGFFGRAAGLAMFLVLAGCTFGPARMGDRIGGRSFESVAFSPDGRHLACSEMSGGGWRAKPNAVVIFDIVSRMECERFYPDKSFGATALAGLVYCSNGCLLAAYLGKNSVMVWDVERSNLVARIALSHPPFASVLSPDGRRLAIATRKQSLSIWTVPNTCKIMELTNQPESGVVFAFSPDARTLAVAAWRQGIGLWDITTGEQRYHSALPRDQITCLAFAPDGSKLAISASDVTMLCLTNFAIASSFQAPSLDAGEKTVGIIWALLHLIGGSAEMPSAEVFSAAPSGPVAISPAGTHLAVVNSAASVDNALGAKLKQVQVFDLTLTDLVSTVAFNTGVQSIAFSGDGNLIATAGDAVEVWDWKNAGRRPTDSPTIVISLQTKFPPVHAGHQPHSIAAPVRVKDFSDARPQKRLGERYVSGSIINEVLAARPPEDTVREAVAACFVPLNPADHARVAADLVGTIRKFLVRTPHSIWAFKAEAEVEVEVEALDESGVVLHSAIYHGTARSSSLIWPSQSAIEQTCNKALSQMVEQLRADPYWEQFNLEN